MHPSKKVDKYVLARQVIKSLVLLEATITGWMRDSGMPPMSGDDPRDLPDVSREIVWITQQCITDGLLTDREIEAIMYSERKTFIRDGLGNRARMRHLIESMLPHINTLIDEQATCPIIEDDRIVSEFIWFARSAPDVLKAEKDQG